MKFHTRIKKTSVILIKIFWEKPIYPKWNQISLSLYLNETFKKYKQFKKIFIIAL